MTTKIPAIAKLNPTERKNLIDEVEKNALQDNSRKIIAETLSFVDTLIEDLKTSKVSIHKLKQLLSFHSEQLKKVTQIR